jgi:hypothetical protein
MAGLRKAQYEPFEVEVEDVVDQVSGHEEVRVVRGDHELAAVERLRVIVEYLKLNEIVDLGRIDTYGWRIVGECVEYRTVLVQLGLVNR